MPWFPRMKVLRRIGELGALRGPVHAAIGVFDGVHRGHCEVIGAAVRGALDDGGSSVVITFDPHPAIVLRPDLAPAVLTPTRTKMRLFQRLEVDGVLLHPFNAEVARHRARAFVESLGAHCKPLGQIAVGWNWTFGRDREGDTEMLSALGSELGFEATVIEPVKDGELTISSTAIRAAIRAGDMPLASRLLGRHHEVEGTVSEGRKLGRRLGFPTANLAIEAPGVLLPPDGVYAVFAERPRFAAESALFRGVANLGVRPTVDSSAARQLEVHLFDFSGDLYGEELRISLVERLRQERKFDSIDALAAQIAADVASARTRLAPVTG